MRLSSIFPDFSQSASLILFCDSWNLYFDTGFNHRKERRIDINERAVEDEQHREYPSELVIREKAELEGYQDIAIPDDMYFPVRRTKMLGYLAAEPKKGNLIESLYITVDLPEKQFENVLNAFQLSSSIPESLLLFKATVIKKEIEGIEGLEGTVPIVAFSVNVSKPKSKRKKNLWIPFQKHHKTSLSFWLKPTFWA